MSNTPTPGFTAGRFRSLTGLSEKALRLYSERGILVPFGVDLSTGYRSYSADQLRDGVTLDLLRRSRIPLDDLAADNRFRFDDHRGKVALRRAMEDFYLDLAERVATGDPTALVARETDVGPAHWIASDVPVDISSSPDDLEETFTAMSVDLPHLDRVLLEALHAEGVVPTDESWTATAEGAAPRMRIAHRVQVPVPEDTRRRIEGAVGTQTDAAVRVSSGTLPARLELVYSSPNDAPNDAPSDDTGLEDTALSYLATIAFARRIARDGVEPLHDTARRRVRSASLFDPAATPEDVYDLPSQTSMPVAPRR